MDRVAPKAIALLKEGNLFGKFSDLSSILFIGGCHAQGQQVSERIYSQIDLASFPAFGAV
jgi:hypothetical protein